MCGIIGYTGDLLCRDILINGLSRLEYRGYDSAGIAILQNGEFLVKKSRGKLKRFRDFVGKRTYRR